MRWMSSAMRLWKSDRELTFCLLELVLMLFLLPLRWLLAAMVAAFIHELGHYTAVRLLGGSVYGIKFGISGAVMEASDLPKWAELVCVIAGPLAGLLLGLMYPCFPVTAICAVAQSIYNLLPIYPLDGGRILRSAVLMLGGTEYCCVVIQRFAFVLLLLLCIYIRYRYGISLFLFLGAILLRNISCKQRRDWI